MDEIFGLYWQDNALRVTQSCELTRVTDTNKDGVADRFDTISDAWGYANYHEYAFGSKLDGEGNQFIAAGTDSLLQLVRLEPRLHHEGRANGQDYCLCQRLAQSRRHRLRRT